MDGQSPTRPKLTTTKILWTENIFTNLKVTPRKNVSERRLQMKIIEGQIKIKK